MTDLFKLAAQIGDPKGFRQIAPWTLHQEYERTHVTSGERDQALHSLEQDIIFPS